MRELEGRSYAEIAADSRHLGRRRRDPDLPRPPRPPRAARGRPHLPRGRDDALAPPGAQALELRARHRSAPTCASARTARLSSAASAPSAPRSSTSALLRFPPRSPVRSSAAAPRAESPSAASGSAPRWPRSLAAGLVAVRGRPRGCQGRAPPRTRARGTSPAATVHKASVTPASARRLGRARAHAQLQPKHRRGKKAGTKNAAGVRSAAHAGARDLALGRFLRLHGPGRPERLRRLGRIPGPAGASAAGAHRAAADPARAAAAATTGTAAPASAAPSSAASAAAALAAAALFPSRAQETASAASIR